jgi:hypothetical protein
VFNVPKFVASCFEERRIHICQAYSASLPLLSATIRLTSREKFEQYLAENTDFASDMKRTRRRATARMKTAKEVRNEL